MKRIKLFEDFVNETVVMTASRPKFDVSKSKTSLAGRLEDFISKMSNLAYEDIKSTFLSIVSDPTTQASDQTRNKWKNAINQIRGKAPLMTAITNLYLKAANMGVNDSLCLDNTNDILEHLINNNTHI